MTMRIFKLMAVGTVLTMMLASFSFAKPEYTKKENKPCATCHTKAGSKELNDVGKCYSKDKSLKDCKVPAEKK